MTSPAMLSQFMRFGAVGCVGTASHYLVLVALVEYGGSNAIVASSIGALVGALVNYVLNRRYTFRSDRSHGEALPRFMVVAAIGFVLNAAVMALLLKLGAHYLFAQLTATVLVLIVNFLANRVWTFKTSPQ